MAPARPGPPSRLPRGRHSLSADDVSGQQRARLRAAAIAVLADRGYGAATVQDLIGSAGVSSATFYALYDDKAALILDACDEMLTDACATLNARTLDDLPATLAALADVAIAEPVAARAVLLELPATGPPAIARHDAMVAYVRDRMAGARLSDATLTVLVAGALHVSGAQLAAGKLRTLRPAAADLAAWGALYGPDDTPHAPSDAPTQAPPALSARPPLPRGRHGLPGAYVRRHQRERILEAVAVISADTGFERASIRDLITAAGLSTEAFYEHFASKQEAWAAAFDEAFVGVFASIWHAGATARGRAGKVVAATDASLRELAADPARARFLLVDAPSAGRPGRAAIDDALKAVARLVGPALTGGAAEIGKPVPEALVAGVVHWLGAEVRAGRTRALPTLAAPLAELILTPPLGRVAAAAVTGQDFHAPVNRDDRRALIDAFADAVARDGLRATRLADVAQRAGVELDVADTLFRDELDCATQAVNLWAGQLVVVAAGAFLANAGDPPLAAHDALAAALRYAAGTAGLTALAVSDEPDLIPALTAARERYTSLFSQLVADHLRDGRTGAEPASTGDVVLDGIVAVLRAHVREGRLAALPDALPALSTQSLAPFFGAAEARRAAAPAAAH